MRSELEAAELWNRRTALASGSGDQIPGPDDVTAPSQMGFLSALGEAAWEQPPRTGSGDHVNHSGDATDMVDHAELARLAEAATKGPWVCKEGSTSYPECDDKDFWSVVLSPAGKEIVTLHERYASKSDDRGDYDFDAAFIAAANPATVLALLAENAALRGRNEAADRIIAQQSACADEQTARATEAERKLAEAVGIASKLSAAISWLDYPFIDNNTAEDELRSRVGFMMKDAEQPRAMLSKEAERE